MDHRSVSRSDLLDQTPAEPMWGMTLPKPIAYSAAAQTGILRTRDRRFGVWLLTTRARILTSGSATAVMPFAAVVRWSPNQKWEWQRNSKTDPGLGRFSDAEAQNYR
jgi:hypothetical protein